MTALAPPPIVTTTWPEVIDLALDLLAFGGVIEGSTFARACRKADAAAKRRPVDRRTERPRRLMCDDVTLERAHHEINARDRAATSTVEALMLGLRERGVAALVEHDVRRRLCALDDD